jgi:hypothetical protein
VRAFEEELGSKVVVPENNILMGAIGTAILTREEVKRVRAVNQSFRSAFRGFELVDLNFKTKTFQCKGCPNRCEVVSVFIDKVTPTATVSAGAEIATAPMAAEENIDIVARWGDRCGKWEIF